jgi:threonyl-tRNA synthetase
MKLLMIHSDHIEWEPKTKAIKSAEEAEKGRKRVEEALVVFAAVEKADEKNPDATIANAVARIMKNAGDVKAKRVVVYPYAHLSPDLSSPDSAVKALRALESALKEKGLEVSRSPFGWYKSFELRCKGHPLSELSAQIGPEGAVAEQVSEAVKKEEKLHSHWYVAVPGDKSLHPISLEGGKIKGFDASKHGKFGALLHYEMAKSRAVDKEPPHISLMKRLELVDYEEGTDPGNFRFYPAGRLVKSLLEDYTTREIIEYGGAEVETPIMYDLEHPTLKSYLNRFPARQYQIETPNKRVFLRFSACFGQFLMAKDAVISYKDLPMRPYELTRYSFRVEQSGELAGLRRLRSFTMPDCHALCADMEMAKEELLRRFGVARGIQSGIGFGFPGDFEFSLRAVKSFYDENRDFVHAVVDRMGKPALLELWDERFFYFVFKMEWNFIDALGKAACLTTDQIDVENAERYGMAYTDRDGKKKHPIILHLSPTGSIERVMYALLEREHMRAGAGAKPMLPLWLSPTQVRIIPVSDKFTPGAHKIAEQMAKQPLRVDVDDRNEPIGARIRKAESAWVPYIAVIGEKEVASGKLAVRVRSSGEQQDFSPQELADEVLSKTAGMPFKKLSLSRSLDHRPIFVG